MTQQNPIRNVCIVGNIASGKSTLARFLAVEIPDSIAVPESFEENPFLEWNFQDPRRWAFTNAVRYFYDYVRVFHETTIRSSYAHYFIDAGTPTNRYIYGRHMLAEGIVTQAEFDLYETLCGVIERAFGYTPPDAYIFVETSPETCFERMSARARHQAWAYQQPITLDYLRSLVHYFHMLRADLQSQNVPLLVLQNESDDFSSPAKRAVIVETIRAFLTLSGPVPVS